MKAIELLRVSTQEQGNDDRAGLPRQRQANAATIQKHTLTIIKAIRLIDVSGTSVLHTPEVKELLQLVQSPYIKGIVVADWDRLIRPDNFKDFALLQHLKETNTLIFLPDQVIDLNTQSGFLMGGFQSIISGNELTQIKKRVLDAKEVKRRNGEHPNCDITLPLGVRYDREKKRFHYTDEVQKVKTLFSLFHDEGITNYCELQRLTGIRHRTIPNLLKNEIYIGYRTYSEKRSPEKSVRPDGRQGDRKKIKRQPDDIIRVRVIENPIIDEKVFWSVRETIENKNRRYHAKKSGRGERFLYSGFLKCGACGEKMYSTSGGRKHKKDYYLCRSKNYLWVRKNGPSGCTTPYLSRELIDNTVTSFISEVLTDKGYLLKMIELALSVNSCREIQAEAERIKDTLKNIKKKRERFLELYGEGLYTIEELNKEVSGLNDEVARQKMRLVKIEESIALRNKLQIYNNIEPIVATLTEFPYWTPHQKRKFLRSQVPEISITNKGITRFTLGVSTVGSRTDTDSLRPQA